MIIKTKEVREGMHTGKEVWICHYLRPNSHTKPLRNVPPTKVLIKSNEELPKGKKVYYSEDHFVPIGKNGKPKAKVIPPCDNSGYRFHCGNELWVFTTENECILEWNTQVQEVCDVMKQNELNAAESWRKQREALESTKVSLVT
jgi:hypothetical protein